MERDVRARGSSAILLATALLFIGLVGCDDTESSLQETSFASPDFTLTDHNANSPHVGEARTLSKEGKIILLYFANYG